MRLWTWQSKDFSLADKNQEYKSLKYSWYVTKNSDLISREKQREAYEKVFQKLKTDQLIWCFVDYNVAVDDASILNFGKIQHCLLWELDIPDDKIIWYCDSAWETLRTGKPKMSTRMWKIFHLYEISMPKVAKKYEHEFNKFWLSKATKDLLNLMFPQKPFFDLCFPNAKTSCCFDGAIVIHPVDKDSIRKNPKEKEFDKWWKISEENNSPIINDENLLNTIPYRDCSGR